MHTDIISPPQSLNTTLDGVVKFICTYDGDILRWEANGQRIFNGLDGYKFTDVPVTSNLIISTLSVVTSLDKNNTNITCTAIALDSETVESEPALLLLQGTIINNNVSTLVIKQILYLQYFMVMSLFLFYI